MAAICTADKRWPAWQIDFCNNLEVAPLKAPSCSRKIFSKFISVIDTYRIASGDNGADRSAFHNALRLAGIDAGSITHSFQLACLDPGELVILLSQAGKPGTAEPECRVGPISFMVYAMLLKPRSNARFRFFQVGFFCGC